MAAISYFQGLYQQHQFVKFLDKNDTSCLSSCY
uniref:Uncharacterized protein n=1 Tax=Rhizophora mucronata TaxID=61149 RepID=A0A2P2NUU3_RHIMU